MTAIFENKSKSLVRRWKSGVSIIPMVLAGMNGFSAAHADPSEDQLIELEQQRDLGRILLISNSGAFGEGPNIGPAYGICDFPSTSPFATVFCNVAVRAKSAIKDLTDFRDDTGTELPFGNDTLLISGRAFGQPGGEINAAFSNTTLALPSYIISNGGRGLKGSSAGVFESFTGTGFPGGNGGTINVQNSGTRSIDCNLPLMTCFGFYLQANGGNGGAGGSGGDFVGDGDVGGIGGAGGNITFTNRGILDVSESWPSVILNPPTVGVFARANGGAGGPGGSGSGIISNRGGNGGGTSIGGDIEIVNGSATDGAAVIQTSGIFRSHAIFAQAVGGFGGAGGGSSFSFAGGSGGGGGDGADGGSVTVTNYGLIGTSGKLSRGIFAQSIGGGGGAGGSADGLVSVGGFGGVGGDGDAVTVSNLFGAAINTIGDRSTGIFAQSVGGGGGDGGDSTGIVAIGGGAGKGGNGDRVDIFSGGAVFTQGDGAGGIFAQSVGGGGGRGGSAVSAGPNFAYSVGGNGGAGGDGGTVFVNSLGTDGRLGDLGFANISTLGDNANALQAQSVGGGGGDGGAAISLAADFTGVGAAVAISIGGDAGAGGNSDDVVVNNFGAISTQGENSNGLFVQSVGGSGGNGGGAISGVVSGGVSFPIAFGGTGGVGGDGASVDVNSAGQIVTDGDLSFGVFAQSVGGGGGNGGYSFSFGAGALTLPITIGGNGGVGGDASTVDVVLDDVGGMPSFIQTTGDGAGGVFAQSVGGGGGNGGFAASLGVGGGSLAVSLGGRGSAAGDADSVTISSVHDVMTFGELAPGIQAQSIGGGGGNGGGAVSLSAGAVALSAAIGDNGGNGGDGKSVTISNSGLISTEGSLSHGIFNQSVGGGGGDGGFAIAGSISATPPGSPAFSGSVGLGGMGFAGGDGGQVETTNDGAISTQGDLAHAIFTQSVGGGGGSGGFAGAISLSSSSSLSATLGGMGSSGGVSDSVTVENAGLLTTKGNVANAIFAQSVGGGGGNGGSAISISGSTTASGSIAIGGSGAGGNKGASVDVINNGRIFTQGAQSNAILAQSVGGGGGNGGFALSGTITLDPSGGSSLGAAVAIGGNGGAGSDGDTVTVRTNQLAALSPDLLTVGTQGDDANGILAQSIGGGGGNGGFSGAFSFSAGAGPTNSFVVSIGGQGGDGGMAGDVDVRARDNISTLGDGSNGIFAQSIGGGGGNGGFSAAGTFSFSSAQSKSVAAAIGGNGGDGGASGIVEVLSTGLIETSGDNAIGLFAQSVGGGGGNGGLAVAATANATQSGTTDYKSSIGGSLAAGGEGGDGNVSGNVTVQRDGITRTLGDNSYGILAQSIGGSGGNGGLAISGAFSGGGGRNLGVSVGGDGGMGNVAGDVTLLESTGTINTAGIESHGIFMQSVGGGGGNGGFAATGIVGFGDTTGSSSTASVAVAVGGDGGEGGTGGDVMLDNAASVFTTGGNSKGLFAQSIGGGGGNGGGSFSSVTGIASSSKGKFINGTISVGGNGGTGNVAGDVSVNQTADVVTLGDGATGIHAQSIGGGGGTGGQANSLSLLLDARCAAQGNCNATKQAKRDIDLSITVGGDGGSGNDAGNVEILSTDFVDVSGLSAHGILAQSIGGGGGVGGDAVIGTDGVIPGAPEDFVTDNVAQRKSRNLDVLIGGKAGSGGDGKTAEVFNEGTITARGEYSYGIFAQSAGGGGGFGGSAITAESGSLSLGGDAGSAGEGGTVTVLNDVGATVRSLSNSNAGAIFVQSIGGGGGQSGASTGKVTVGGNGGSSGNGGEVSVTNHGILEVVGSSSHGIFAQSIGGGGGTATESKNSLRDLQFGGDTGSSGNGGLVTIYNNGSIVTSGSKGHAVFLQSIGGGGGAVFSSSDETIISQRGSNSGDGNTITFDHTGEITTLGDDAYGVFAQSIGGGGGYVEGLFRGSSGGAGSGGAINLDVSGNIFSLGRNGTAIFAQSAGAGAEESININIGENSNVIGGDFGVGVQIYGGRDNLISNRGQIDTLQSYSGVAVMTGDQNDTIENFGRIAGSIDLGAGSNKITNRQGALFESGSFASVGGVGLLNEGILSPGGSSDVSNAITLNIVGDFVQSSTGTSIFDLSLGNLSMPSDKIVVDGVATLGGKIEINALSLGTNQDQTLLEASGGVTDNGLLVTDSALIDYGLSFTEDEVNLTYMFNQSALVEAGATSNEVGIASFLFEAAAVGNDEALNAFVSDFINIQDSANFLKFVASISPEHFLSNSANSFFSASQFTQALMSCRQNNLVPVAIAEGECAWGRINHRRERYSGQTGVGDYRGTASSFAFGVQKALSENWRIGFGAGIEQGDGATTQVNSSFDRMSFGAVAKYQQGRFLVGTSVNANYTWIDTNRVSVTPIGANLFSTENRVRNLVGNLRLAYLVGGDEFFVKPRLDMNIHHIHQNAFSEQLTTTIQLQFDDQSNTIFEVAPAIEFGGSWTTSSKAKLMPTISAGFKYLPDTEFTLASQLTAAATGFNNLSVTQNLDKILPKVDAGISILFKNGTTLRGFYEGIIGVDDVEVHQGSLKLSVPF